MARTFSLTLIAGHEELAKARGLAVQVLALEGSGHGAGIVARLTAGTADRARASSDADGQRLRCTRDRSARPCSLFFEVWSAEQPTADAARPSVHREERSSICGACERQAHDLIIAQSGQGWALLREETQGQTWDVEAGTDRTGRNKIFAKRDASGGSRDG